jgi:uncharacterized OB-fold protein
MSVPRYWRESIPRYRLLGKKCNKCGAKYFPSKPVCQCGCTDFSDYKLADAGKVVTWSVIRNPPKGFERYQPYIVALVELDDGVKVMSQVVDVEPENVKVGIRVEAVFRRVREDGVDGIIQYGYKFRPVIT